uniref:Uncharacterized protein n=1 Tax=Rhizophora mucronata TaxID=61149 RepID=A0A2P2ILU9_RHIMU
MQSNHWLHQSKISFSELWMIFVLTGQMFNSITNIIIHAKMLDCSQGRNHCFPRLGKVIGVK